MTQQPKAMTEAQVNALISALEQQRNTAMNALAEANASLSLTNTRLQQMASQLDALLLKQSANPPTEEPKA